MRQWFYLRRWRGTCKPEARGNETRAGPWRPVGTREALEALLAAAEEVPVANRVAYFDNDGTLCRAAGDLRRR